MSEKIASADVELQTMEMTLYQAPSEFLARVETMSFHNTSGTTRTVHLFFKSGSRKIKIAQFDVVANGRYIEDTGWTLMPDDRLHAYADATGVTCKVNATEVEDG